MIKNREVYYTIFLLIQRQEIFVLLIEQFLQREKMDTSWSGMIQ